MMTSKSTDKRLAIFFHSFTGGGAERVMLSLAREFLASGYDVDLVVVRAQGPLETEVPPGASVHNLDTSRILVSLPSLVHYLRRRRPSVMLVSQTFTNCIAILARFLSRTKTSLVLSEHSIPSMAGAHGNTLQESLIPYLIRLFYRYADGIVAVSNAVAQDMTAKCGVPRDKVRVIYNPIFTAALAEKAAESVDHHWFAPDAPPVILGVGRLVAAKDFPTLIAAFSRVRKRRKSRLVILGEGPHRGKLEDLVDAYGLADSASLPGFVENPYKYMRACSVFVLSSRWEGFANVVVEALACGPPVVATNCVGGPSEILEHGRWGTLVKVGDAEAMAEAIVAALDAPPPSGLERAYAFTAERAGAAYLEYLERVHHAHA